MGREIVFTNEGKLFRILNQNKKEEIVSDFGQQVINRSINIIQKSKWKTSGKGAQFTGTATWSKELTDPSNYIVQICGVCPAPGKNKIIYAVKTNDLCGLFEFDIKTKSEKRLLHKNDFSIKEITINKKTKQLLCVQTLDSGIANISLVDKSYTSIDSLTEGDSVDQAPVWHPGNANLIIYQSSGIARDGDGSFVALGPVTIESLDLSSATIHTIMEDSKYDFLAPKYNSKGTLFAIRRPYQAKKKKGSLLQSLKDTLFFPYRLFRAIIHFLNYFSLTFSNKPLVTSQGTTREGKDAKAQFIKGRMIELKNKRGDVTAEEGLVDKNWELVSIDTGNHDITIIEKGVSSFDIAEDDSIIFSNGTSIYSIRDNKKELLFKDKFIEEVYSV